MNCYSHMNCNFLQFIGKKQKIYWYNNIKWKLKEVDIKNRMSYFFDKMINIKNLDWSKIKTDEKSYKNIFVYNIWYVTIRDLRYADINSVNRLYIIINKRVNWRK